MRGSTTFYPRPRRFGKSLFVDTLHSLFACEKELFKGLYVYDKWNWDKKHPVVHLDFSGGHFTASGELQHEIRLQLGQIQHEHLGKFDSAGFGQLFSFGSDITALPGKFRLLLAELFRRFGERVVVLVG